MLGEQIVDHPVEQAHDEKPEGFEPVSVDHLPDDDKEAIQARFDRLYGQVKMSDRRNKVLEGMLAETQKALQDINHKVNEQERTTARKSLEDGIRMAEELGDLSKANQLRQTLTEMNIEDKMRAMLQQKSPPSDYSNPDVLLDSQMAEVQDPYESAYLNQAMAERGVDGNYVRPWAQRGHPDLEVALREAEIIWTSPRFSNKPVEEKMKELDRRMGTPQRRNPGNQVLPSGGMSKQSNNVSITPMEERVATRLFPRLSRDEAIAKYMKGKR